jgi:ABC-2 type transport system permease protein
VSGRPGAASTAGAPPAGTAPGGLVWFGRVLLALVRREARTVAGYRIAFAVRGAAFALTVLALAFLSRLIGAATNPHLAAYGGDYLAFAVVGLVVMDLQQVGVSNLSQRVRMAQLLGVLEAEMATPTPTWILLAVGPVYEYGVAIVRSGLYLLLAILVFGVGFHRANPLTLALAAPLVMGAFVGLGLLSAATTMLVRRTNPVAVLLASASMLLSGVAYPVSVLPPWLRAVGRFLPLTHALELVRGGLLRGAGPAELTAPMTALALFTGVLCPVGVVLFVYALRRARIDGSLTHF